MDNINLPKCSIIIAVHNNSQYIRACVESALAQDYPNVDVWVVDDGSTEDVLAAMVLPILVDNPDTSKLYRGNEIETVSMCGSTSRMVFYLKLKQNGGPSRARNIAIVNAMQNGSHLFLILDSDDCAAPNKITKLIEPILRDPEHVAVTYADYYIKNDETGAIRYEVKKPYDMRTLFMGECIIHSGSLINGLMLRHLGEQPYPEDQRVAEDYAVYLKLLRNLDWVAVHIAEPLTVVLSHKGDSTSTVAKEQWNIDFQKAMSYR